MIGAFLVCADLSKSIWCGCMLVRQWPRGGGNEALQGSRHGTHPRNWVHSVPLAAPWRRSGMDPTTQPSSEDPVARARERAGTAGRPRAVARFSTFTSLHHRDFVFLWLSNLCNASANWFQQFTIPWLVWDISHSPFWVGMAAGMRSFPFLFIGPLAGVFADRVDRRTLVLVIQTTMAVVVFAFAVAVLQGYIIPPTGAAHHAPTGVHSGVLYATAFTFLTGALHALSQPVRQAMVANTVPRRDLWNAIALNSIAGNVARVVGPALGGVIYAWLSPAANFFIQGGLFLLMALMASPSACRTGRRGPSGVRPCSPTSPRGSAMSRPSASSCTCCC